MDSIPRLMFKFNRLRSTVDDPTQKWQLALNVVADFAVVIDGLDFYSEREFPVVEFASQAARWLREGEGDLFYVSMESSEEPLLGFYSESGGQFRPSSPYQLLHETTAVDSGVLRSAVVSFISELRSRAKSELNLDIERVL